METLNSMWGFIASVFTAIFSLFMYHKNKMDREFQDIKTHLTKQDDIYHRLDKSHVRTEEKVNNIEGKVTSMEESIKRIEGSLGCDIKSRSKRRV